MPAGHRFMIHVFSSLTLGALLLACGPAEQPAPVVPATPTPVLSGTPRRIVVKPTPSGFETPVPEPTPAPAPRMSDPLTSEGIRQHLGQPGVVRLAWSTESEKGSFGFNVMRATDAKGPFTPANPDPILGAGTSSTKMAYEFFDTNVKVGDVYFYYMQQLDLDGSKKDITEWTQQLTVKRLNLDKVKVADAPTSALR